MSEYRVLNAMRVDTCPEALEPFKAIGVVDMVLGEYDSVAEVIGEYDAYLAAMTVPFDAAMVARAKKLKVIGTPSTGTDHIDRKAVQAAGIECFDISKELDLIRSFTATSELAFALLLNVNRKIFPAAHSVFQGGWGREDYSGFQLSEKVFGILGLGRLGTISARIAQGFGMKVIACDAHNVLASGVEIVDFDTLFRESDALSIHVHLDDGTRGLVDARALSLMKSSAILLNTSRAAVVDDDALLEALSTGKIGGAGLDIIDGEWDDDIAQNRLVAFAKENENLLITPHIGGATYESINGARIFMARKVADYLRALKT